MIEPTDELLYDDSEWTTEELREMLARSAKENGWEKPEMEAYDREGDALENASE
jgi:hypothetical protein